MYVEYENVLTELYIVGDSNVEVVDTVLSDLTVVVSGDTFTFTGGTPVKGDVLFQSGYAHEIIDVTGTTIKVNKSGVSNLISNGPAKILHSDVYNKVRVTNEILIAQSFIDEQTRQWFEPRNKIIRLEGQNSNVMFFNVPIISISEIRLNSSNVGAELTNFEIFNGSINRRNPRIKILSGTRNIFTSTIGRTFRRASYTEFEGTFGFVEDDLSTPPLIKKAMLILTLNAIKSPIANSTSLSGVGALKREKTDLHEQEYFQPDDVRGGASGAISGNIEVDRILKMYKAPIPIGGSIMDLPRVEDVERSEIEYYDY